MISEYSGVSSGAVCQLDDTEQIDRACSCAVMLLPLLLGAMW